jgi:hypothetical protein
MSRTFLSGPHENDAKDRKLLHSFPSLRIMDLIKPNFEEGGGGTFPQGVVAPLTPTHLSDLI